MKVSIIFADDINNREHIIVEQYGSKDQTLWYSPGESEHSIDGNTLHPVWQICAEPLKGYTTYVDLEKTYDERAMR